MSDLSDAKCNEVFSKLCKENADLRLVLYWIRHVVISSGDDKLDKIKIISDHALIDAVRSEMLGSEFAPAWVVDFHRRYDGGATEKEALK